MKEIKFLILYALLAIIALPSFQASAYAKKQYPDKGAIVVLSFNNSLKDAKGKVTFKNANPVETYVTGVDGNSSGAVRLRTGGGYGQIKLWREPTDIGSMVITFRIDTLNYTNRVVGLYPEKLLLDENGHIQHDARRENSTKEEHYHCDMGLQTGKWVTLAVVWDYVNHTATYYANGKKWEVTDFALEKRTYGSETTGELCGFGSFSIDEFRLYDRILTDEELKTLCSTDGQPFENAEQTIDAASLKMNWMWASIQIAFAALCLLFFNRSRKKLEPVTVETLKLAGRNDMKTNPQIAMQHLNNAFGYWGGIFPADDPEFPLKPHYYPENKTNMKSSLLEFKEAVKMAGNDADEDLIENLNLYVKSYNLAHTRKYNGKWWIFLVALACVYIRGLIPEISFGLLDNNHLIGMPDGFLAQVWYLSKYILPGVIISAIAYYAASYGLRWRICAGAEVLLTDLKRKTDSVKQTYLVAGVAIGGSLLVVVGGAIAGVVAIGLIIAGLAFAGTAIIGKHGTIKEVWVNRSSGNRRVVESANPMAFGVVAAIFGAVILAMYFFSGIIIALFNVLFIYKAIQNYIIKS
jgi:hypothetical protein